MDKFLKIGHRGAPKHFPENTIESFKKAIELGVDMIELDVHKTEDNVLMVNHDNSLWRNARLRGKFIEDLVLSDFRFIKIFKKYRVPKLCEVMKLVSGRCYLNIEIKNKKAAILTAKEVQRFKAWNWTLISSKNWGVVKKVKEFDPKIKTAIVVERMKVFSLFNIVNTAKKLRVWSVNLDLPLARKFIIKRLQKSGFKVLVWVANEKKDINRLKKIGVDGIFSDYPDRL